MSDRIYFDYAAATPLDERVFAAMQPYFSDQFHNPSAMYGSARRVKTDYQEAKHRIASHLGAKSQELIMTAGATESIALALTAARDTHIVTSAIEHDAVLASARQGNHSIVAVDGKGMVNLEELADAITDETTLVSIGYANSELGTIQRLRLVADIIEEKRAQRRARANKRPLWFHTDASQAAGLLDLNVSRLGVDMLTLNAAKCYGPKQVGLLWARSGVKLSSLIPGGGQERGLRSGTENVAGVIGFAEALRIAEKKRKSETLRFHQMRDDLQKILCAELPELIVSGHPKYRLANHLHVALDGLDAERVVFALDMRDIEVATGSACAANKHTRSHVLEAIGLSETTADGSIRLTLGRFTKESDIERIARTLVEVMREERQR